MQDTTSQTNQTTQPQNIKQKPRRRNSSLLLLFASFFVVVALVFIFQQNKMIAWVENYQQGIELSKQQNKPALLAFYKTNNRFNSDTWQNTYSDPKVIQFVETNLVPVLIDVDKQPQIAEQFKIGYYPTHYIKYPDSDELLGPMIGYDPPDLFLTKIKDLIKQKDSAK